MSALDKFLSLGFSVSTSDEKIIDCRESIRLLLAERDSLVAQVAAYKERSSELYKLCDELIDHLRYNKAERDEVLNEFWNKQEAIKHVPSDPQQCLAEIKAEAGRAGYLQGVYDFQEADSKHVNFFNDVEAEKYAAKIRNTGTWLKDSNVNGGKRQGGEK